MRKQVNKILATFLMALLIITMMPVNVFANTSNLKDFEIITLQANNFNLGSDATFKFGITNSSQNEKDVYLLTALYNKETNKMITYNYIEKNIGVNEQVNWGSLIAIPDEGDYLIKAFAWDNLINPVLLSNVQEITLGQIIGDTEPVTYQEALLGLTDYIKVIDNDPEINTVGGEWGVLGLARNTNVALTNEYVNNYCNKVINEVTKQSTKNEDRFSNKVTDVERIILALSSLGKNPANIKNVNLYNYIWNKEANFPNIKPNGKLGGRQGANELIFGLLALDALADVEEPVDATITRQQIIDKLIDEYQMSDGGFSLTNSNKTLNIDITAMAVQALSRYYNTHTNAKNAIDRAIVKLSNIQNSQGEFCGEGELGGQSSEALCQVIVALSSMNIDANSDTRFIKNNISVLKAFLSYYDKSSKGFRHVKNKNVNLMASEQALYTLVAYDRFKNNQNSLYDMSDVEVEDIVNDTIYPTNISLNKSTIDLKVGSSETLQVIFTPNNTTEKELTYRLKENNGVISVDNNGTITALKAGTETVIINAQKENDVDEALMVECVVTVTEQDKTPIGKVEFSVEKRTIGKGDLVSLNEYDIFEDDNVWTLFERVLKSKNINYKYSFNEKYDSVYVSSIDGDGEFDHGSGSGWKYEVNGVFPNIGASQKTIQNNDVIRWRYCITPDSEELTNPLVNYLKQLIEEAEDYEIEDYTSSSYSKLQEVIEEVKIIANDNQYNSKQTDKELVVSEQIKKLNEAVANLVEGTSKPIADTDIPSDWQNDVCLNSDFERLSVGEKYNIYARRLPELVGDTINNTGLTLPPMHYEIVSGDSVTVENKMVDGIDTPIGQITAVKEGISIIKVYYDEVKPEWSSKTYDACSAVNYAYMAVEVNNSPLDVEITTNLNTRAGNGTKSNPWITNGTTYDTVYYTEGETVPYNFNVSTDNDCVLEVSCNGTILDSNNGEYIANLENRTNVIGIKATKDGKQKCQYYSIDARKIEITIKNDTRKGEPFRVGDTAKIKFKGLNMPISKLAGIYNPCFGSSMWGGTSTGVMYTLNSKNVFGRCHQWDLATNNTITVRFDEAGQYNFINGCIDAYWWGDVLDSHKNRTCQGGQNIGAVERRAICSSLPNFTINVDEELIINADSITLNESNKIININDEFNLVATILPDNTTNKNVTWESSNEEVATVNNNGKVVGIKEGSTTITVTTVDGNFKASCDVTVNKVDVKNIELSKNELLLQTDETSNLTVIFTPNNTSDKNIVWSSSDEGVATVSDEGVVTAVSKGTAIITATSSKIGVIATCNVTVQETVIHVNNIKLNKDSVYLSLNSTNKLIVNFEPTTATNKNVVWNSSNEEVVTVDESGNINAKSIGVATITATSVDNNKIGTCEVHVENYMTKEQKQSLKDKIDEAKVVNKVSGTDYAYNMLQDEITSQEIIYNNDQLFSYQVDKAVEELTKSIENYNKACGKFRYNITSEEQGENTIITIEFPNMDVNMNSGFGTTDIRLKCKTNIPELREIFTENMKLNREGLRTLSLSIPTDLTGNYMLSDIKVVEIHRFLPNFPATQNKTHFSGQMPYINIKLPFENITESDTHPEITPEEPSNPTSGSAISITDVQSNQRRYSKTQGDVFYYTVDEEFAIDGQNIEFINEGKQIKYGSITKDFISKQVEYTVSKNNNIVTVQFKDNPIIKPLGSISGTWNCSSSFGGQGEMYVQYTTNIEGLEVYKTQSNCSGATLNTLTITLPEGFTGELKLTDGSIFEKSNQWSPGIDGMTEGYFGRLPNITVTLD